MVNLAACKKIFFVAVLAGLLAGLVLTAVQKLQVTPIISQAEVYEEAAGKAAELEHVHAAAAAQGVHQHADGQYHDQGHHPIPAPAAAHADAHEHEHGGWQPEDGAERTLYTTLSNVNLGVGFALLLAAALFLRDARGGWRAGLLWGAAGYLVFFVAPSLGLPPEVPGTAAAPLGARQFWWLSTVLMTAVGLALLVFGRGWPFKLLGAALLLAPHLIGAPQPLVHASSAPEELARSFIYASAAANAVFWLTLGALAGLFHKKFA